MGVFAYLYPSGLAPEKDYGDKFMDAPYMSNTELNVNNFSKSLGEQMAAVIENIDWQEGFEAFLDYMRNPWRGLEVGGAGGRSGDKTKSKRTGEKVSSSVSPVVKKEDNPLVNQDYYVITYENEDGDVYHEILYVSDDIDRNSVLKYASNAEDVYGRIGIDNLKILTNIFGINIINNVANIMSNPEHGYYDGVSFNYSRKGIASKRTNYIFYSKKLFNEKDEIIQEVIAHELGHNIHLNWYYTEVFGTSVELFGIGLYNKGGIRSSSFKEGVANYFLECLGYPNPNNYSIYGRNNRIDTRYRNNQYIHYLESFGFSYHP